MNHDAMRGVADAYTVAWNSGSPEAVADLKVAASRGWFDADDYARQAAATP